MKFINKKTGVIFLLLIAICSIGVNEVFAEDSNGNFTSNVGDLATSSIATSDSDFYSNSISSGLSDSNDAILDNDIVSDNTSSNNLILYDSEIKDVFSNDINTNLSANSCSGMDNTSCSNINENNDSDYNFIQENNLISENSSLMDNVSEISLDNSLANQIINANNGDTIYLQAGFYDLSNININKNLTIQGLDYKNTIIDGNNNLIFTINPGITLSLINLQIIHGDCEGLGVIYNQGNLFIRNCSFYNNKGVVIYNFGLATIEFSRFFNNDALDKSIFKNKGGNIDIFYSDLSNNHAKYTINNQKGNVSAHYDWWGSNNGPKDFIHGNVDANNFVIAIIHIGKNQTGLLDFTYYKDINGKISKLSHEIPNPEAFYKLVNGKNLNIYDFNGLKGFLSKIIIFSNVYGFLELSDNSYNFVNLMGASDLFNLAKLFKFLDSISNSSMVCTNYGLNYSYEISYYDSFDLDLDSNLNRSDLSIVDNDEVNNLEKVYYELNNVFFDYGLANESYSNLSLVNLNSNLGFVNFGIKRFILNQLGFNNKLNTYLSGVDLTLNKGESANFTVYLKDENCEGLAGQEVNITILNEKGLSEKFILVSGTDGIVSLNFNLDEGVYEVESSYLGSSQYEEVKTINTINVVDTDKMSTNLEKKFFNTEQFSCKFQFKLEDYLGNGIAGQEIQIIIKNQNNTKVYYDFNTTMDGILEFACAVESGIYELNVNFFGSSEYLPSNINQYFIVKD